MENICKLYPGKGFASRIYNEHFTRDDKLMTNKNIKISSVSLFIKKRQIKTKMR